MFIIIRYSITFILLLTSQVEPSLVYCCLPVFSAAVPVAQRPVSETVVPLLPKIVNVATVARISGIAVAVSDAFTVG